MGCDTQIGLCENLIYNAFTAASHMKVLLCHNMDRYSRVKRKSHNNVILSTRKSYVVIRNPLHPLGVSTVLLFLFSCVLMILSMQKPKKPNSLVFSLDKSCKFFSHSCKYVTQLNTSESHRFSLAISYLTVITILF